MSKILLVEDNEMNRDMLSRRLIRRGYEVILAVDGESGLALAGTKAGDKPTGMAGFSLPPHRVLTVPATAEVVQRLGLKDGVKVLAADLSGL